MKTWFINGPFDNENDIFLRFEEDGECFDVCNFACNEAGKTLEVAREVCNVLNNSQINN